MVGEFECDLMAFWVLTRCNFMDRNVESNVSYIQTKTNFCMPVYGTVFVCYKNPVTEQVCHSHCVFKSEHDGCQTMELFTA